MTNFKDQIQHEIRRKRESSERAGESRRRGADDADSRLDEIRPRLDELPHATDTYILKTEYAVGPYASVIAIVELYDATGAWVARWEIAPTVGGSAAAWEVTCKPRGAETFREWFRNADELFDYLTAVVAKRVVEMEADDD